MNNICIFGASIIWGANDLEKGGWANRLRLWVDEKTDYEVATYNLGVSGDTTDDLLEHFEVEARAREPVLIIFSIGVNDAAYDKEKNENQVSLPKFMKNMRALLEKAKAISGKVAIVGLGRVEEAKTNPIPWAMNIFYKNEDIARYDTELKKLAADHQVPYLGISDLLTSEELDDGLHPNAAGHEKIYLRVRDFLTAQKLI